MYVVVTSLEEESEGSGSSVELLHSQPLHHLPVTTWYSERTHNYEVGVREGDMQNVGLSAKTCSV